MTNLTDAFTPKPIEYREEEPLVKIEMLKFPGMPNTTKRATHLINTIAKHSPIGKELLENVAKEGYKMQVFAASFWAGMVAPEQKHLFLNASCSDAQLIETLAHEARHIQQYSRGVDENCDAYALKESIMLHRGKEADAETMAAAVCYELKINAGINEPWEAIEKTCPKIAEGFKKGIPYEGAPVSDKMLQGAFDGWFENEATVKVYEDLYIFKGTLDTCFDANKDQSTLFYKNESASDMAQKICVNHKGDCYWADNLNVLEEPTRLAINQSTIDKADTVFKAREEKYGLKHDYSYRNIQTREALKEQKKTPEKTVETAKKTNPIFDKIKANRSR